MKRKSETLGELIRRIRGEVYQAKFGRLLGVSQATVSAWERDDEDRTPSADMYFRLAMLASRPEDQASLLQKAGLTGSAILSAAERIRADRSAPPSEGEIFRVAIVRCTTNGIEETGELFPVAASKVECESSTVCLIIDEYTFGLGEAPFGLYILDTSLAGAEDVGACKGWTVVRYAPESSTLIVNEGLYAGQIRTDATARGNKVLLQLKLAALGRASGDQTPILLGLYEDPDAMSGLAPEDIEGRGRRLAEMREHAWPKFPLLEGVSILGRVIGWYPR